MGDVTLADFDESSFSTPQRPQQGGLGASTPEDPYSPNSVEEQAIYFPASEDEQIVNTALLSLLKGLIVTVPAVKGRWTLSRLQLVFKIGNDKVFEARTDGYLKNQRGRAKALVEVKAGGRSFKLDEIRMQESAQMIAFIRDEDLNGFLVGKGKHK